MLLILLQSRATDRYKQKIHIICFDLNLERLFLASVLRVDTKAVISTLLSPGTCSYLTVMSVFQYINHCFSAQQPNVTSECHVEGQIQNLFITAENYFGKYCSGKTETDKCAETKAVNQIREDAVSKLDGSLSTPDFRIFIPCPSDEVLERTTNFTLPSDNKIPFCIFSPKNSPFSVMKTSKSKL